MYLIKFMIIKENLYKQKSNSYFSNVRKEIFSLLPHYCENILDLGCGNGSTLAWIKEKGMCKNTYGIDISKECYEKKNIDFYLNEDLEQSESFFKNIKFDIILILDVLEHLIDPDTFLKKVLNCLKKNGSIILCIPNIRHYSIFKNIFIKGDFHYTDSGILDKTHLRFYTKKSIIRFLANNNLTIKKTLKYPIDFPSKSKIFNMLTLKIFSDFLTQQYIFKINRND